MTRLSGLAGILARSVAVYDELAEALYGTRGAGSGDRVSGGGGDERPMPLQAQVAEHRHLLVRGLRHWLARVRQDDLVDLSETAEHVASMGAYIINRLDRLEDAERAELRGNMLDWQHRARVLTDLPMLRGTIPLPEGTCPAGIEGLWECQGALQVLLPADHGNAVALRCAKCGGRWDVSDLPAAADVRLNLHDAAYVTRTSLRTLQYRVQHGQVPATAGYVRLGDVLRSERALV